MTVHVTRDAVETAIRISEIVLVIATLTQAAGAFSFILSSRRWQKILVSERESDRKQFEGRLHELEGRLATATAVPAPVPAPAVETPVQQPARVRVRPHRAAEPRKAAARSLSPDDMQILVARLVDAPPMHVEILLSASAPDAEGLAEKLRVTLSEAKWTIDRMVPDLATADPHGLALMVPDWNMAPPGARVLADSLRRLGFHVVEINGEDKRVGVLTIFIGPET